jgi:PilZ domain
MIFIEDDSFEVPLKLSAAERDRRAQLRVPMRIALVIRTLDIDPSGNRAETLRGWTEDISTTGIRIVCPRVPLTGGVWVSLQTRRLRKRWFEVDSIWSTGVTTNKGPRQRVGISFTEPLAREELDRILVARALSQLRASMPRCADL